MSPWIERDQQEPFDTMPIAGRYDLIGDLVAEKYGNDEAAGKKYPLVRFESGVARELKTGDDDQPHIHVLRAVDLPYHSNRDEAHAHLEPVVEEQGLRLTKRAEDHLGVDSPTTDQGYVITFDNVLRQVTNMTHVPRHAMELMPGEIRAALSKLYAGEKKGMDVLVPVKYFTADAGWTWYLSEYDGDDLLFGLVSGFEIELGYVSLTELESIRGGLGLPVERDLYYTPQSLKEVQAYERRLRGR